MVSVIIHKEGSTNVSVSENKGVAASIVGKYINPASERIFAEDVKYDNGASSLESTDVQSALDELTERVDSNKQEAQDKIGNVKEAFYTFADNVSSDIVQLQKDISGHASAIEANTTRIAGNVSHIEKLESEVSDIKDDVAVNTNSIALAKSHIASMKGDIEELESATKDLETTTAELQSSIADNAASIEALEERVEIHSPILLTQQEYDALQEIDPNKTYYIY